MTMKDKVILSLLLLATRLLLSSTVSATPSAPLRITTAEGFVAFAKDVSNGTSFVDSTVFLEADIDLTGIALDPIGGTARSFAGTFDGQGHTIGGMAHNTSALQCVGLFGYSDGLTIRNIVLDASCSVESSSDSSPEIGGLIGKCFAEQRSVILEGVVNMASVTYTGNVGGGFLYIGGVTGWIEAQKHAFTIRNCANYGPVTHSGNSGDTHVGGIVGLSAGQGEEIVRIQNSLNYGPIIINGTATDPLVGGIVGENKYTSIENCVVVGRVSSSGTSGAILGYGPQTSHIEHCFWTSNVGCNGAYGNGSPKVDAETSLVVPGREVVDKLNAHAVASSSWNKWLHTANNAQVAFKINGGQGFATVSQLTLLPDPAPNDDKTFWGWYTDEVLTAPFASSEVRVDTTLYGLFCGTNYTVTLDVNGGNALPVREVVVACNGTYGTLPTPTRVEAAFEGWFTERVGGGVEIRAGDRLAIMYNHTLYARWAVNRYTAFFVLNNGADPVARTFDFNATVEYPKGVSKVGHTLAGWAPDPAFMPARNLTIVALWDPNNYTVTFDPNGGQQLPVPTMEVTFNRTYGRLPAPNRSGYIFRAWLTDANETVTNMTVVAIPGNHTLHAEWEKIRSDKVEIIFGAEGMSRRDVEDFVRRYTEAEFAVASLKSLGAGETRAVVKFGSVGDAVSFEESVRASSDSATRALVKYIGCTLDESASSTLFPAFLSLIFIFAALL